MRLFLLSICALGLLASSALAQSSRVRAREIAWHTFVGGLATSSARSAIGDEPGRIDLGESAWSCGFARTRFAGVGTSEWSVQRVLACRRGEATVSSTAWCRLHRGHFEEHAATLSLGTTGDAEHVTVTLSCDPPRR
ncbi:MAG TPA: hypothetical protein ENK57_20845 [Polyangiaceae bacterium]|nr:hypothetical protein [Polyangiaceae bacterium]